MTPAKPNIILICVDQWRGDCLGIDRHPVVRTPYPHIHGEQGVPYQGSAHYLTDGHEKYIWYSGNGQEQLFDLDRDPAELKDLASNAKSKARLTKWRTTMAAELKGREEGFSDGRTLIAGRPVKPVLSVCP